jgi:putative transposase
VTDTLPIIKSYKYALDPTSEQVALLRSHIGGSRFAYNALLGLVKDNWDENRVKKESGVDITSKDYLSTSHFGLLYLWAEHRDEMAPWWEENGVSTYNDAAQRLSKALTNYYTGRAKVPKTKKRGRGASVRFTAACIRIIDSHHVRISRIGELKTYESTRKFYRHVKRHTGRIVAATITESGGKFFISFTVELTRESPPTRPSDTIIGIDLGLTTLYTGATPEGVQVLKVENSRNYQKSEKKLAHAQHIASRRDGPGPGKAPSKRWAKANARVQKTHTDVVNARKNLIHEATTMLAKNYDVIVVENLNIKGILKNKSLAKHISDAAWGEFVRQLTYKTKWYGSTLVKADRFYPSSKTCSSCGTVKAKLLLDERVFNCEACGLTIDRDVNAAINLARLGLAGTNSVTGREGEIRPVATADQAHPAEASTKALQEVGV